MLQLMPSTPVTLITGLLGSGKSTLIQNLIQQKPKDETWGIVINEFGEVDIDGALLQSQFQDNKQLLIQSVSGGCICCTAHLALTQAINALLKHPEQLDRIIIEPTGLGHPAKILDVILSKQQQPFIKPIKLENTVCLVTAMQLTAERWKKSQVMRDLVTLADTLIINKTDLATEQELTSAHAIIDGLYPAKTHIIDTQYADISYSEVLNQVIQKRSTSVDNQTIKILGSAQPSLKSLNSNNQRLQPSLGKSPLTQVHLETVEEAYTSKIESTQRCFIHKTSNNQLNSIGWVWNNNLQFNRTKLKPWLDSLQPVILRAKGIIKTGNEWQLLQWADEQHQLTDIAWRMDSRLELFFNHENNHLDADSFIKELEDELLGCIHKT